MSGVETWRRTLRSKTPRFSSQTHGDPGHATDRLFNRAGQASQVLLLFLGIFGYFYTVVPAYQKSLLDEEIARRTLQLGEMERTVSDLQAQILERSKALEGKDRELAALNDRVDAAQQKQVLAEQSANAATAEASLRYRELRRRLTEQALASFEACAARAVVDDMRAGAPGPTFVVMQRSAYGDCIRSNLLQAPKVLASLHPQDVARYERAVRAAQRRHQAEFEGAFATYLGRVESATNEASAASRAYDRALSEITISREVGMRGYLEALGNSMATTRKFLDVRSEGRTVLAQVLRLVATDVLAAMARDEGRVATP